MADLAQYSAGVTPGYVACEDSVMVPIVSEPIANPGRGPLAVDSPRLGAADLFDLQHPDAHHDPTAGDSLGASRFESKPKSASKHIESVILSIASFMLANVGVGAVAAVAVAQ